MWLYLLLKKEFDLPQARTFFTSHWLDDAMSETGAQQFGQAGTELDIPSFGAATR
jgi:hypothetical protein